MTVFITGITGFIGRHLANMWQQDDAIELFGCARRESIPADLPSKVQYHALNIVNGNEVYALMESIKPDVIIHAAAMSRPNDCALDSSTCFNTNVQAVDHIVEACKRLHARLIFLSSDMAFGDYGPYTEADNTCPVNYYGETKVAAEKLIQQAGIDYAIIRTVLVYGKKLPGLNNGFLQWVLENISQQKNIRVFTDQFRTATYINDLCKGIDVLTKKRMQGIFHICGDEKRTPYEMAVLVAAHHKLDTSLIAPITSADMQEAARRPANCTLSIEKARQELGYRTTSFRIALQEIFD